MFSFGGPRLTWSNSRIVSQLNKKTEEGTLAVIVTEASGTEI